MYVFALKYSFTQKKLAPRLEPSGRISVFFSFLSYIQKKSGPKNFLFFFKGYLKVYDLVFFWRECSKYVILL